MADKHIVIAHVVMAQIAMARTQRVMATSTAAHATCRRRVRRSSIVDKVPRDLLTGLAAYAELKAEIDGLCAHLAQPAAPRSEL